MNPQEKGKMIFDEMLYHIEYNCQPSIKEMVAKQCSLVAVGIILNDVGAKDWSDDNSTGTNYWQDVWSFLNAL